MLTLTARTSRLELRHDGGDGNPAGSLGKLAEANLDRFTGHWVEVSVRQVHANEGELNVSIYDVATGLPILLYANDDIDLWRGADGATDVINRPKWGIYRSYNADAGLKDETVRFANFCSSENGEAACPSRIDPGTGTLEAPTGILPLDGSVSVPLYMSLVWDAVAGATAYRVYLGSSPTDLTLDTSLTTMTYAPALAAATTYYFQIGSVNEEGEARSETYAFTTLDNPDDGGWDVARGQARPEVEAGQFFAFDSDLELVGLDSVARLTDRTGNNAYCYFSGPKEGDNNNYRWRYRQEADEETTLILRLRALADVSNIAYVDFYGLGWRQKLRINRSTLKFERTPDNPEVNFPEGYWDDGGFHVLRITFANNPTSGQGMVTTVYLDEDATPFGAYPSDESQEDSYLDIGRAGGTDYGACFDYLSVNPTGAYAPGSGAESVPPNDLELPEAIVGTTYQPVFRPALYPNPTAGRLVVSGLPAEMDYRYRIVTATGRQVVSGRMGDTPAGIDTKSLTAGIYFLQLTADDGGRGLARFVRQ